MDSLLICQESNHTSQRKQPSSRQPSVCTFREALTRCAQVAFNIGGPALNQLANIADKRESDAVPKPRLSLKKRSVAAGLVGLTAASLLATPQAEAATEAFQLAAGGWHPLFCHLLLKQTQGHPKLLQSGFVQNTK